MHEPPRQIAREESDQSEPQHLERRPRTLTEPDIRQQHAHGSGEEACLRAEIHRRNDDYRGDGLEQRDEPPEHRQRRHYRRDDHTPRADVAAFDSCHEQQQREHRDTKRDYQIPLSGESERAHRDEQRYQHERYHDLQNRPQSQRHGVHRSPPFCSIRDSACSSVTAPSKIRRVMREAAVV